jgi:hypothetical protein
MFPVSIDTDGSSTMDSLVFNHYFYFSTTDAHSGSRALEISNAYNYTRSECITGAAGADTDSVFTAYGSLDFLPATVAPGTFNFYYKYLPLNNDSAIARMVVYDSFMSELGKAELILSGTHAAYTLATAPVVMSAAGNVGFISVFFSNSTNGHPPTFGTRLVIDDINLLPAGIGDASAGAQQLLCYPSANGEAQLIALTHNTQSITAHLCLCDINGRQLMQRSVTLNGTEPVSIDVNNYPSGIYMVKLVGTTGVYTTKFIH